MQLRFEFPITVFRVKASLLYSVIHLKKMQNNARNCRPTYILEIAGRSYYILNCTGIKQIFALYLMHHRLIKLPVDW